MSQSAVRLQAAVGVLAGQEQATPDLLYQYASNIMGLGVSSASELSIMGSPTTLTVPPWGFLPEAPPNTPKRQHSGTLLILATWSGQAHTYRPLIPGGG